MSRQRSSFDEAIDLRWYCLFKNLCFIFEE